MFNANGTDESGNLSMTQASEAYDNMFAQKTEKQEAMSTYEKSIKYYTMRIDALNLAVEPGSEAQMKSVEENLDSLYNKITVLLEKVNATANEYYENVAFANAVNYCGSVEQHFLGRLMLLFFLRENHRHRGGCPLPLLISDHCKPCEKAAQNRSRREQKAKPDDAKEKKPEAQRIPEDTTRNQISSSTAPMVPGFGDSSEHAMTGPLRPF